MQGWGGSWAPRTQWCQESLLDERCHQVKRPPRGDQGQMLSPMQFFKPCLAMDKQAFSGRNTSFLRDKDLIQPVPGYHLVWEYLPWFQARQILLSKACVSCGTWPIPLLFSVLHGEGTVFFCWGTEGYMETGFLVSAARRDLLAPRDPRPLWKLTFPVSSLRVLFFLQL